MGYGSWQGIDVARVVETNATRLPSIREVDKRKPAFGHARSQSDWSGEYSPGGRILRVPALGQRRTFQSAIAMSADILPSIGIFNSRRFPKY
jgi:hypothetical protein